jgi:hypothetical protein
MSVWSRIRRHSSGEKLQIVPVGHTSTVTRCSAKIIGTVQVSKTEQKRKISSGLPLAPDISPTKKETKKDDKKDFTVRNDVVYSPHRLI